MCLPYKKVEKTSLSIVIDYQLASTCAEQPLSAASVYIARNGGAGLASLLRPSRVAHCSQRTVFLLQTVLEISFRPPEPARVCHHAIQGHADDHPDIQPGVRAPEAGCLGRLPRLDETHGGNSQGTHAQRNGHVRN
eukprot:scaffold208231_cov51-Prasinocladus_malaysianus.AAC.2